MSKLFTEQDQNRFEELLRARRDVRGNHFQKEEPITDTEVQRILEAAIWAPSVGFSQPWEFVVIRDDSIKQKVVESFSRENEKALHLFDERQKVYQALKLEGINESPVNIAVFYRESDKPVLGQTTMKEMGEYSVVCAVQNMWLMARSMNIGIGWVSILDPQAVKQAVAAPENLKLVAYLCVGKVDEFLDRPELEQLEWDKRKALETVVRKDRFK